MMKKPLFNLTEEKIQLIVSAERLKFVRGLEDSYLISGIVNLLINEIIIILHSYMVELDGPEYSAEAVLGVKISFTYIVLIKTIETAVISEKEDLFTSEEKFFQYICFSKDIHSIVSHLLVLLTVQLRESTVYDFIKFVGVIGVTRTSLCCYTIKFIGPILLSNNWDINEK